MTHTAQELILDAAIKIRRAAVGTERRSLVIVAEGLRNLAMPILLAEVPELSEIAERISELSYALDANGDVRREIMRAELAPEGLIECNTHGASQWLGDVSCSKCLRFYRGEALFDVRGSEGLCACGEQLLPRAGMRTTGRPLCHECAAGDEDPRSREASR